MPPSLSPAAVGQPAPLFSLPSLLGNTVDLAAYRGRRNVVVWFSRGFTCPFCRDYMNGISEGYTTLLAEHTEVIQVAPNLLESARGFFGHDAAAVTPSCAIPTSGCTRCTASATVGALEATRTAVVSFAHAFTHGDGGTQMRGAWLDVVNRNFVRRLHHHAMTAHEQGMFLIDKAGRHPPHHRGRPHRSRAQRRRARRPGAPALRARVPA